MDLRLVLLLCFALLAVVVIPLFFWRRLEADSIICIDLFALIALFSFLLFADQISMPVFFIALAAIGVVFVLVLFWHDTEEKKTNRFISSERLLGFSVEILVAIIGFGITLFITNAYERNVEKENAIQMLTQTIEYTEEQTQSDRSYLNMYDEGKIERNVFLNSSVFSMAYYESVLTNEVILQNANMKIHGDIMSRFMWIEQGTERAKLAESDKKMRAEMYWRYADFIKVLNLLIVSRDELAGEITPQEAETKREEIYQRSRADEIKLYETPVDEEN